MPFVKYRKLQCHPTESISPYTLNQLNKHEGLRKQERKGRVKETMKYSEEANEGKHLRSSSPTGE